LVSEANRRPYRPPDCSPTPPSKPETCTVPSLWTWVWTPGRGECDEDEVAATATGALTAAATTTAPAMTRRRMMVVLGVLMGWTSQLIDTSP
jgi:hypothetical protein